MVSQVDPVSLESAVPLESIFPSLLSLKADAEFAREVLQVLQDRTADQDRLVMLEEQESAVAMATQGESGARDHPEATGSLADPETLDPPEKMVAQENEESRDRRGPLDEMENLDFVETMEKLVDPATMGDLDPRALLATTEILALPDPPVNLETQVKLDAQDRTPNTVLALGAHDSSKFPARSFHSRLDEDLSYDNRSLFCIVVLFFISVIGDYRFCSNQ
jgi:hypothetical protein